jgi:hypothetical protein
MCNITKANYSLIYCAGVPNALVVKKYGSRLTIHQGSDELLDIQPDNFFTFKGNLYTVMGGKLLFNRAEKLGVLTIVTPKMVANIFESSYQVFENTLVQDIVGIPWIIIPGSTACYNIQLNELSGHRVIDAKYDEGGQLKIAVIISEFKSNYFRSTIIFKEGDTNKGYSFKQVKTDSNDRANIIALDKSVAAAIIDDERLDLILEHGTKEVSDPPFDISMQMFTDGVRVLVVNGTKILHISTK